MAEPEFRSPEPLVTADRTGLAPPAAPGTRRRLLSALVAGTLGLPLAVAGVARLTVAKDEDDDDHDDDDHDDSGQGRGRGRGRGRGGDDDGDVDGAEAEVLPPVDVPADAILVEIFDDDGFTPSTLTIDAGQQVAFVNYDNDDHTATGSGFDTGVILEEGGLATVTLDTPGRYPFACLIHPEMTGEISVRDENGNVPERAAASPPPTGAIPVDIANLAFAPATVAVRTGETVVWTNSDSVPHTVTAVDGIFDSGIFDPGATFSWTFSSAGTFAYQCALHPEMTGEVTATGDDVATGENVAPVQRAATPAATPAAVAADEPSVLIVDLAFEPPTLTVPVGATVTWTNAGVVPHTVSSDEFSSEVLNPEQTFRHEFADAGTFAYFCALHPEMTAEIVVEPA